MPSQRITKTNIDRAVLQTVKKQAELEGIKSTTKMLEKMITTYVQKKPKVVP